MDKLEKLFQIPEKHSPMVFHRYYCAVYWHRHKNYSKFNMQEFDKPFRDFLDNYWLKYHQDNEDNLRVVLSQLANCSIEDLPEELIYASYDTKNKGLFQHKMGEAPHFQYYYSTIFDPYFQNIKSALIAVEPLFGALSDHFLKAMIVNHLDSYQSNYHILKKKYKEGLPCFYERVIYYGFNVLYQNSNNPDLNKEDYRLVLSQIYMNHVKTAA
jgi:hypothetical protein